MYKELDCMFNIAIVPIVVCLMLAFPFNALAQNDTEKNSEEATQLNDNEKEIEQTEQKSNTKVADKQTSAVKDDNDETSLTEVIVTAARRKTSWKEAPAMVTVIKREEITQAPETTVDEFLKRVPSISYKRTHIAECGPGREITLRGIHEQKRTLVLVDGIPVNEGGGGSVNWSLIPKELIERIEIVRGPMSALYGSGAMGGAINIITRKPYNRNHTLIKAGYGSLNSYSGTIFQGGMFEKVGYQLGGNIFHTDGYKQAKDEQDYYTKNNRTDVSLSGKFYVKPDDSSTLSLGLNFVDEKYSRGLLNTDQNNRTTMVTLGYEKRFANDTNLTANVYGQFMSRQVDLGAPPTYDAWDHTEKDDITKIGQLFQTNFKVGGFNTISVGVDSSWALFDRNHEYYLVDRNANAKGNQLLASLFAQDEMEFVSGKHKFLLTPGVRLDYSRSGEGESYDNNPANAEIMDNKYKDRSWTTVNPKLAFVYRYNKMTTVRASFGRSFAAPTLFELYTVFSRGPYVLYGNPELTPESSLSGELGIDQWFLPNLLGRVSVSYTRGYDFIGSRSIDQNTAEYDNITTVQMLVADAELNYDINKFLSIYTGYTFNWSTILEDENDPTTEENNLPFVPSHRGRAGVIFKYKEWIRADLSLRYEGKRYTDIANTDTKKMDDYFSLDLSLSGRFVRHLKWTLSIENILNKKYDIYSVPNVPAEAPGILANGYLTFEM